MTGSVTVRRQKVRKPRCRHKLAWLLMLAAALLLALLFIERRCPHDPNAQVFAALEPPSAAHPAGTDRLGRDLLSRILIGLRTSVLSSLALVAVTAVAGSAAGVLSGYFGGLADSLLMRIADVCLAFPGLVLGLAVAALLGGGLHNAMLFNRSGKLLKLRQFKRVSRNQNMPNPDRLTFRFAIVQRRKRIRIVRPRKPPAEFRIERLDVEQQQIGRLDHAPRV